jgi:cysteine desulfurase/selenocysteine lyase
MQTGVPPRNLLPEWVQLLRHETPSTMSAVHFNNAGSSPMPSSTAMVVTRHIQLEQEVGGYEAQRAVSSHSESVYNSIAQLVNCDPTEIALLESAGEIAYK